MKKHVILIALILCLALASLAACDRNQADPHETEPSAETWLCACGQENGGITISLVEFMRRQFLRLLSATKTSRIKTA